jgi:hypothetical protein
MGQADPNPALLQWLSERGYSPEEVQKIMARLAEREHQTLSDAVFDSIGSSDQSLEQLIGDLLRD